MNLYGQTGCAAQKSAQKYEKTFIRLQRNPKKMRPTAKISRFPFPGPPLLRRCSSAGAPHE